MKLAVPVLSLFLVLSPSQAKMSAVERVQASHKRSVSMSQMRTKSVLARAVPRAQRRLLVTNDLSDSNNDPAGPDELDLQTPYARPRVTTCKQETTNDDVSDYVAVRLAVARARAMEIHRTNWA